MKRNSNRKSSYVHSTDFRPSRGPALYILQAFNLHNSPMREMVDIISIW